MDRHRIRRLMVEAWRLNKQVLYEAIPSDKQVHLFFIFTGKEMPDYDKVLKPAVKGINLLAATLQPKAEI